MNPNDPNESSDDRARPRSSILATEGWHRLITVICFLVCVGLFLLGVAQVIEIAKGWDGAKTMDYLQGEVQLIVGPVIV